MASSTDFLPSREAELVTWINTFQPLISATPTAYGLSSGQATTYSGYATAFLDAYALANADATRSPANIVAKDAAKKTVVDNTRLLARIIQATPAVTDAQKTALGLTVRAANRQGSGLRPKSSLQWIVRSNHVCVDGGNDRQGHR
ncbi:MAG TPA: hypothetical protein VHD56_14000 [Tepidisphaeraceae bacterium]|nr:hypothetical protein [Tepidisphaeraceae bacterium]